MVLTILSKLGHEFFVFLSTFHCVIFASGSTWNMPFVEDFIESLTQEKTKLINMGTIKGPGHMHSLCNMEDTNVKNLKINTNENLMHI
jgi:hypothetical protein